MAYNIGAKVTGNEWNDGHPGQAINAAAWVTQTLQGFMIPNFILYIKKENLLKSSLAYVEELRDHHMPMLKAADMYGLR